MLKRVTLQSSGLYRCEVSGEAPAFNTVSESETMIVVGKSKIFLVNGIFTHKMCNTKVKREVNECVYDMKIQQKFN